MTRPEMQLCELQARLFESLDRRNVDAKKFIRAFMNSRAAEGLDADYDRMQWAGSGYVFEEVMDEAGLKVDPACPRYDVDALFYAGWIYRVWHYLTGETSREIYAQADENDILASYGLHVEADKLAVEDLKELARAKRPAHEKMICTTTKGNKTQ